MDLDRRLPALLQAFADQVGGEPAAVWAAPGRVNLMGEHTDYNDGLVLPIAIDRQALVAVRPRDDGELRCRSLQEAEGGDWEAYPRGVARALADAGHDAGGADLLVDSDVPSGGGLSSSAALECAVALALTGGDGPSRQELASICQRAENEYVGAPTGIMDQSASMLATARHALLLDCRDLATEQVPLPLDGLALLVIDTKASHSLGDGAYAERRSSCDEAARALGVDSLRDADLASVERLHEPLRRRARHVVTEIERVRVTVRLLRAGRARDLGPVLLASHASMRDDFEISVDELDVAVEQAVAAGAVGARMTGGGFGGSAIALVPDERVAAVDAAVKAAYDERGWPAPDVFAVSAADGASRVVGWDGRGVS